MDRLPKRPAPSVPCVQDPTPPSDSALRSRSERLFLRVVVSLFGRRVRVEGAGRLPQEEPVLFALNHLNAAEALLAPIFLIHRYEGRKIAFLCDWMYFYMPLFGWALRRAGAIPVWSKRAKLPGLAALRPRRRIPPLEAAGATLRRGRSVAFYPEGRRNPDPTHLLPGKPGLARLALHTGVPIVPVGVDYEGRAAGRRAPLVPRLTLRIGHPLTVDRTSLDRDPRSRSNLENDLTNRVMEALASLSGKRTAPERPTEDPEMNGDSNAGIVARRVSPGPDMDDALSIVDRVYVREKGWMSAPHLDTFPGGDSISWFLVRVDGEAAGLLRVVYDPPLHFPSEYRVELRPDVDWKALAAVARVAEVGRFMILEGHRRNTRVAVELMRVAIREIVERDYTHLVTDVFEGDPHSPYDFHTRVLGFEEIGSHAHGEMRTDRRRIILALDIDRAYLRMRARGGRFYRNFTEGYRHLLEERISGLRDRPLAVGE